MQRRHPTTFHRQSGVVLVMSLLLLLVITLLALSMFRSVGVQELIAGSLREKDRALQSATSAQQYAEYWLVSGNNVNNTIACSQGLLNANSGDGYVCTNQLLPLLTSLGISGPSVVPWGGNTTSTEIGIQYTPPNMSATSVTATFGANQYFEPPRFYIALLGNAPGGVQGQIYQIDAWAYGGDPNTVVVVESTYLVTTNITDLST